MPTSAFSRLCPVLLLCALSSPAQAAPFDKEWIVNRLSEWIGRELSVGDIDINWGWRPSVQVSDVRIANVPWGAAPYLARIGALELQVNLRALTQRDLVIPTLSISEPQVFLEVAADGRTNWTFANLQASAAEQETPAPSATPAETQPAPIPLLEQLSIENGQVLYRNLGTAAEITLTLDSVQGRGGGGEPLTLAGQGQFQQQPLKFDLKAGSLLALREGGGQPYPLNLSASVGGTTFSVEGTLTDPLLLGGADLALALQGTDLATLPVLNLPKTPAFQVNARLLHEEQTWTLRDLEAQLGRRALTGMLAAELGGEQPALRADLRFAAGEGTVGLQLAVTASPPYQGQVQLTLEAFDLQQTLAGFAPDSPLLGVLNGRIDAELAPLTETANLDPATLLAHLTIADSQLTYQAPAADTELTLTLASQAGAPGLTIAAEGAYRGEPVRLRVTGDPLAGAAYTLEGELAAVGSSAAFNARFGPGDLRPQSVQLSLQSPEPARFAALLGAEVPPLPPVGLQAAVTREEATWRLDELVLTLDQGRLTGSAVAALDQTPPRFQAALAGDTLDLRPFIAALPADEDDEPATAPDLSVLGSLNAALTLQVQQLILPQLTLNAVTAQAALTDGVLRLEPLHIGLGGGQLAVNAALDATAEPWRGQVKATLTTVDLNALTGATAAGTLSGELAVTVSGAAATGGDIAPFIGQLSIDSSRLVYRDPASATALTVRLASRGPAERLTLLADGQYQGQPLRLSASGDSLLKLRDLDAPYDLALALALAELRLRLSGELVQQEATWALRELEAHSGASELRGRLAVTLGGEKPAVEVDLYAPTLNIEQLLASLPSAAPRPQPGPAAPAEPVAAGPVDLAFLNAFNALAALRVDTLILPGTALEQASVRLAVQDGRLTVDPLRFVQDAGEVRAQLTLATQPNDIELSGEVHYRVPTAATDLVVSIASARLSAPIQLVVEGSYQDEPVQARLAGSPPAQWLAGETYALTGLLAAAGSDARLAATFQPQQSALPQALTLTVQSPEPARIAALLGAAVPDLPPASFTAALARQAQTWRSENLKLTLGNSQLQGQISVATGGDKPLLTADLNATTLDLAQLLTLPPGPAVPAAATPEDAADEDAADEGGINLAPLQAFNADLAIRAERIVLPESTLAQATLNVGLHDGLLTLDPFRFVLADGSITARARLATQDTLQGQARLELTMLDLERLLAGMVPEAVELGFLNGQLSADLLPVPPTAELTASTLLAHLRISDSRLRYIDSDTDTELALSVAARRDAAGVDIIGEGVFQGAPVRLSLQGDALTALAAGAPYALRGDLAAGDIGAQLRLNYAPEAEPPLALDAYLSAGTLDLRPLLTVLPTDAQGDEPDAPPATAATEPAPPPDLAFLRALNADVDVAIEQVLLPEFTVSDIALDLTLAEGRLQIEPLQATVNGGSIAATATLDATDTPWTGQASAEFARFELEPYGIPQLTGTLSGELNLAITDAEAGRGDFLPYVGRVAIDESQIIYRDPATRTAVTVQVATDDPRDGRQRVRLDADGRYQGEAFALKATGDSLLNLRDTEQPYALTAALAVADTEFKLDGRLWQPLQLKNLDMTLAIAGPNPERLSAVLGVPMPELPPYTIKGRLQREGDAVTLDDFVGRVGDSDLSGRIRVDLGREKPLIEAELTSDLVDFDDLAGLIGSTPDAGPGETVAPEQQRENAREEQSSSLLPRESLKLERLGLTVESKMSFRGKRIEAPKLPMDDVHAELVIENGQLRLTPLEFGVGGGTVRAEIALDTRGEQPEGTVEAEISRVNLRAVLAPFEIADDSLGLVGGRLKFWVQGNTMADLAASADGGIFLLMTGGQIDVLLVELAGLDPGEALVSLLADDRNVPIDCAYANIQSDNGIMQVRQLVFDTSDTLFLADGFVDFNQELIGLTIEPKPKDFSIFSTRSPLHIEGSLQEPSIYPGAGPLLSRGIAAAALAALAPPAALLPLIEPGTGEDSVYCQGLVATLDKARE